jgi:hypothetical protein
LTVKRGGCGDRRVTSGGMPDITKIKRTGTILNGTGSSPEKEPGEIDMKGILITKENRQAVRDERKTQTRRLDGLKEINENPDNWMVTPTLDPNTFAFISMTLNKRINVKPRYIPGETVYMKEPHHAFGYYEMLGKKTNRGLHAAKFILSIESRVYYDDDGLPRDLLTATYDGVCDVDMWYQRSPLFLPEKYARTFLNVTNIRVERVQDISEEDAIAEGIEKSDWEFCITPWKNYIPDKPRHPNDGFSYAPRSFQSLWDCINLKRGYGWDLNPWVWVVEFQKRPRNFDT